MTNQKIDWKKEALARKEDFLEDLFTILRIDSVRDDEKATEEAPVGPGPKEALEAFLAIGERDGFVTKNFNNLAGHMEFGQGNETLGVLAHVDVVPTGTGWETDPFEPVIKDGRLYARGASDDKGPGMAAYYALKIIKDLGLPVNKNIRFILGTDEESDWQGLEHYLSVEPEPDFGFSPDAEFPIINGEKGNISVYLETEGSNGGDAEKLLSFHAGLRENMVPQDAIAVFESKRANEIEALFQEYVADLPVSGTVGVEGNKVTVEVLGKAAHGSHPRAGINAATYLAHFLTNLSFGGDAGQFIEVTALNLHEDPIGEKLGVAHTDDIMGELSSNPGVFVFTEGEGGKISVNMRFPKGTDVDTIFNQVKNKVSQYDLKVTKGEGKEPHYVSPEDPLVKTLMEVYTRQTGLEAQEKVIGGGTYGRLLKRGVAYGAMFPDSIDTMHQANEFMAVDDLMNAMAIYAEAIYELVK